MDIVLASTSPYRRALLERLGLSFECEAPKVDEEPLMGAGLGPDEVTRRLARAKALDVAGRNPHALVIGADQVVELDGAILGKPGDEAGARAQLARLSGRTHRLVTAAAIVRPDGSIAEVFDVHEMDVRRLSAEEIARYVEAERPVDCAGSYKIEGLGISLFDAIRGDDHTAIVGLPLIGVGRALREAGVPLP